MSKKAKVLSILKEKELMGKPYSGVDKVYYAAKARFPELTDVDVAVSISRLVKEGKVKYALDGIRVIEPTWNNITSQDVHMATKFTIKTGFILIENAEPKCGAKATAKTRITATPHRVTCEKCQ